MTPYMRSLTFPLFCKLTNNISLLGIPVILHFLEIRYSAETQLEIRHKSFEWKLEFFVSVTSLDGTLGSTPTENTSLTFVFVSVKYYLM